VLEVYKAATAIQDLCRAEGWRFCIIGGLALQRWGEPRETIDVDLTLLAGFGDEERFIRGILAQFEPRVEDPIAFALANRVVLAKAASGVGMMHSLPEVQRGV